MIWVRKSINLDPSLHQTCCPWFSVRFLCNLTYLSLFSLLPFLNNDLLTATIPLSFWWDFSEQCMNQLKGQMHLFGHVWGLCRICFYFLKRWLVRYCSSAVDTFLGLPLFFSLWSVQFLQFFPKGTLHTILKKFLHNTSLGIPLVG